MKQNIGVLGLGVMGKNLSRNIKSHGYSVSVYSISTEEINELMTESEEAITPTYSLKEFVDSIEKPRKILLMVRVCPQIKRLKIYYHY